MKCDKSRHDTNCVTGGTTGCCYDKFWYQRWRQSWHHDTLRCSMYVYTQTDVHYLEFPMKFSILLEATVWCPSSVCFIACFSIFHDDILKAPIKLATWDKNHPTEPWVDCEKYCAGRLKTGRLICFNSISYSVVFPWFYRMAKVFIMRWEYMKSIHYVVASSAPLIIRSMRLEIVRWPCARLQ